MSDNKKYYYLKVKDTFFDNEEMKLLESLKNGTAYQCFYLKICLLSAKNNGALLFKEILPYDIEMLSSITRTNIDTVRMALDIFKKIGLIDVLDNETIYLTDIESLVGHSSTEAERKKTYRDKIKNIQAEKNKAITDDDQYHITDEQLSDEYKIFEEIKDATSDEQLSDEYKIFEEIKDATSKDINGTLSQNRTPESEIEIESEREKELYIEDALEPTENTKVSENSNALSALEVSLREEKINFVKSLLAACQEITGESIDKYNKLFIPPVLKCNYGEIVSEIKQKLENAFNSRSFDFEYCIKAALKKSQTQETNINFAWRDFVVHLTKLLKDGARGIPKHISELEKQQALERQKCFQDKKLLEEKIEKEEQQRYQNKKNAIAKKYNIPSDVMESIELNISKARIKGLHIRDPVSSNENLEHNIKAYLEYVRLSCTSK